MAGKTVVIGCRLPHGIILNHPLKPAEKVEIQGMNKSLIIGATHMTTEVDAEFWDAFKTVHKDFAPLKSGAIFEAKSQDDAKAIARERAKEKTGFEGMTKEDGEKMGVKPNDKE